MQPGPLNDPQCFLSFSVWSIPAFPHGGREPDRAIDISFGLEFPLPAGRSHPERSYLGFPQPLYQKGHEPKIMTVARR